MVDAFQPSPGFIPLPTYDGKNFVQADHSLNESLKIGARCNDSLCIDCLFTLAFEPTRAGREALSFLFDLYTGKEGAADSDTGQESAAASNTLREALGKDSLKLYETITARNDKFRADDEYWQIPVKFLLMAGFETESHSQLRTDIVAHLNTQEALTSLADPDIHKVVTAIFDENRYVTGEELNAVSAALNRANPSLKFLPSWTYPHDDQQYGKIIGWIKEHNQSGVTGTFVPLLISNEHWILLGIYRSGDREQPIIFDSLAHMHETEVERLEAATQVSGALPPLLKQKNLQDKNAPNTCGVHVKNAMQAIAQHPHDPESALDQLISLFSQLDGPKKRFEMLRGRAELLGAAVDQGAQPAGTVIIQNAPSDTASYC